MISAIMLAPLVNASSRRSRVKIHPPSETTIPFLDISNGRLALFGSSCFAKAPWLLKPAKMPNVCMLSLTPPARAKSTYFS